MMSGLMRILGKMTNRRGKMVAKGDKKEAQNFLDA